MPLKTVNASNTAKYFIALLAILHAVGALGLAYPSTRAIFLSLSPIQLLVTFFGVILLHPKKTSGLWTFLIPAILIGWGVEVAGVATGRIFGAYGYGAPLGPGVLGVPFIIGVNWATLVYCVSNLMAPLPYPIWAKSLMAGLVLAGYDALMEPAAIKLGFWAWTSGSIDGLNYPGWFALGSLLAGLYYWRIGDKAEEANPVAGWVLVIQMLFFWVV